MSKNTQLPEPLKRLLNGETVTVKYLLHNPEPLKRAIKNNTTMKFYGLDCYVYEYGWDIEGHHMDAEVRATKDSIQSFNPDTFEC